MSGGKKNVVMAWQGLPFYARRCIRHFVDSHPQVSLTVITSKASIGLAEAEAECGCKVVLTDSEQATSFQALGVALPEHLFVTSWSHAAYRALAIEAKAQGVSVTTLVDNCFRGSLRQWLGAVYFRLKLRRLFDSAWVPGRSGRRFMQFLGMPPDKISEGLYCADEAIFSPPEAKAGREGVLYVGQFIERKNVGELWQAWKAHSDVPRLSMVGEGPLKKNLVTAGAPVEEQLAPTALARRLREVSALILPSKVDHWGLVLHEAALSGCLLIATRSCGAAEDLIEHGANGYIMARCSSAEVGLAVAWLRGLTPEKETEGRLLSLKKAGQFNRPRWSETLAKIFTERSGV